MRSLVALAMLSLSLPPALGCSKRDAGASTATDDAGAIDSGETELPRAPSPLPLADIVGFSTHTSSGTSAASVNERAFEWSKLGELGIHRIRTDFTWATIEPRRGTFGFSSYDALVSDATAHGVDVLAILDYGVPWATSAPGADSDYPPDSPADFAAFAGAVATRYAGAISSYEIWNEPNNGFSFWKPTLGGDPTAYGALIADATSSILAATPGASVAYGGTVYDTYLPGPSFVAQSFAATPGLAPSLSTFAMHAYEPYPPNIGPESTDDTPLVDKVATMSAVLSAAGARDVPIWITEIGWPVTSDVSPEAQARYTVRSVILGALAGADRVYLYTLFDGPHPSAFPPEDAFGVIGYVADWTTVSSDAGAADAGPAEKPSFVALRALLGALGGFTISSRLAASPSDAYLVELRSGARRAWIAWRSLDGAPAVPLTIPATGKLRVTRMDGGASDDVADGSYSIAVGPDPIIVTQ